MRVHRAPHDIGVHAGRSGDQDSFEHRVAPLDRLVHEPRQSGDRLIGRRRALTAVYTPLRDVSDLELSGVTDLTTRVSVATGFLAELEDRDRRGWR